jgi:hypothetical protein
MIIIGTLKHLPIFAALKKLKRSVCDNCHFANPVDASTFFLLRL